MSKNIIFTVANARILAGATFLATLSGCLVGPPVPRGHLQTTVTFQDDYDYYPGYETYYSRNRHEYVYLEGNVWVRRPEPRGVSVSVFLAAPSVRMDFRDAPEQHHRTVIRSYPRSWQRSEAIHQARPAPQVIVPEHEHRENRPAPQAVEPEHREGRPEPAAVSPAHRDEKQAPPANKKQKKDREKNRRDDAKDDRNDNKDDDRKDDRREGRKDNH